MNLVMILLLILVYLTASFIQGLTGFAFGLISVPLFSILYGPRSAVGMVAVTATILVAYNYLLLRRGVEYRRLIPFVVAAVLFIPGGVYFLHHVPAGAIMVTLGAVIIGLTIFTLLFQDRGKRFLSNRAVGYAFAAASGLLGGAFSSPGPPMVAYLYASDESRLRARANIQFYFMLTSVGILATHIAAGTIDGQVLLMSLPFVPVMFVGLKLGVNASARMPVRLFALMTDAALIALGLYLILTNIWGAA